MVLKLTCLCAIFANSYKYLSMNSWNWSCWTSVCTFELLKDAVKLCSNNALQINILTMVRDFWASYSYIKYLEHQFTANASIEHFNAPFRQGQCVNISP